MKRKIFAIINIAVCLVSMCLLFLPVDFSYIYMAEILLSAFFIPLLIVNCAMTKKKMALCMTILQTASLLAFVVFVVNSYSHFLFGWKLNLILCSTSIPFVRLFESFWFWQTFCWICVQFNHGINCYKIHIFLPILFFPKAA